MGVIWGLNTVVCSGRPEKERAASTRASLSSDMSISYRRTYRESRMAPDGLGANSNRRYDRGLVGPPRRFSGTKGGQGPGQKRFAGIHLKCRFHKVGHARSPWQGGGPVGSGPLARPARRARWDGVR